MRKKKVTAAFLTVALVVGASWLGAYTRSTVSAMSRSAEAFIDSLNADQKRRAQLDYDIPDRVQWHFIPKKTRKGLPVREMSAAQKKAANALLKSGLSEIGYKKSTLIMSLESILHELEGDRRRFERDPNKYYFTVFGDPSGATWGWSVEGHHLSLNFVVEDGKIKSATPAFFGANPATVKNAVKGAPGVGTQALGKEESLAFNLLASFQGDQRKAALIAEKAPAEIRAAGAAQPPTTDPVGLSTSEMNEAQRKMLWGLLEVYAKNMPEGVGDVWLKEIEDAGFGKVHFSWQGASEPGVGHYYRIQGPTFLVEFVNTQSDPAGNKANHIHAVWRSLSGDFGIPL